jgi:homoserine kinase type II
MLLPDQLETATAQAERWFGASVASVLPIGGGATNAIFEVTAAGSRYYLRRHRALRRDAVTRQHALIRHVTRLGIPAPLPIDVNGESVTESRDGIAWAMFEAADGVQVDGAATREQIRAAGEMLAALHAAAASAPSAGFSVWPLAWDGPSWVARLERVRARILELPTMDDADRWALTRVEQQADWLANPGCRHAYQPSCAAQLIHGDYQLNNLFFRASEVTGVIDWDSAMSMPRAFELARACFFICEMRPSDAAALLDGYQSVTSLTSSELDDGAAAWGVFADHHVWALEEVYLRANRAAARYVWHRPFRPFLDEWRETLGM